MARVAAGVLAALLVVSVAHAVDWAAIFLDANDQALLCAKFLVKGLPSAASVDCDHLTIIYNPPSMAPLEPLFGMRVTMHALAFGMDDHDQAVLMHVDRGIVSNNSYPHVTVACEGVAPYTAVYSNFLWERMDQRSGGPLNVTLDVQDKPITVSLSEGSSSWSGTLGRHGQYAPTNASVWLLDNGGGEPLRLTGTFCAHSRWDDDAKVCHTEDAAGVALSR